MLDPVVPHFDPFTLSGERGVSDRIASRGENLWRAR
jgi:hypothetical protein